jgi:hypothetical protein
MSSGYEHSSVPTVYMYRRYTAALQLALALCIIQRSVCHCLLPTFFAAQYLTRADSVVALLDPRRLLVRIVDMQ